MPDKHNFTTNSNSLAIYQIQVKGYLGSEWSDWFEGLTIYSREDGLTIITTAQLDQAALYGLLKKIRNSGLFLVSVNTVEPAGPDNC